MKENLELLVAQTKELTPAGTTCGHAGTTRWRLSIRGQVTSSWWQTGIMPLSMEATDGLSLEGELEVSLENSSASSSWHKTASSSFVAVMAPSGSC